MQQGSLKRPLQPCISGGSRVSTACPWSRPTTPGPIDRMSHFYIAAHKCGLPCRPHLHHRYQEIQAETYDMLNAVFGFLSVQKQPTTTTVFQWPRRFDEPLPYMPFDRLPNSFVNSGWNQLSQAWVLVVHCFKLHPVLLARSAVLCPLEGYLCKRERQPVGYSLDFFTIF